MFCYDVLEGQIDSPELLSKLNVHYAFHYAFRTLRSPVMFRQNLHRTNYGQSEPLKRMSEAFNEISFLYEAGVNKFRFKKDVKNYLELS